MEWGFDWLDDFIDQNHLREAMTRAERDPQAAEPAMIAVNEAIVQHSDAFYGYKRPWTIFAWKSAHRSCFRPTFGRRRCAATRN